MRTLLEVTEDFSGNFKEPSIIPIGSTAWDAICEADSVGMDDLNQSAANMLMDWCENHLDATDFVEADWAEYIDLALPIYYYDQKAWYATNRNADDYCERVLNEGIVDTSSKEFTLYDVFVAAMYLQLEHIVRTFADAIEGTLSGENTP